MSLSEQLFLRIIIIRQVTTFYLRFSSTQINFTKSDILPFQCRKIPQAVRKEVERPTMTKMLSNIVHRKRYRTKTQSKLEQNRFIEKTWIGYLVNGNLSRQQQKYGKGHLINFCCQFDLMELVGQLHNGLVFHLFWRVLIIFNIYMFYAVFSTTKITNKWLVSFTLTWLQFKIWCWFTSIIRW